MQQTPEGSYGPLEVDRCTSFKTGAHGGCSMARVDKGTRLGVAPPSFAAIFGPESRKPPTYLYYSVVRQSSVHHHHSCHEQLVNFTTLDSHVSEKLLSLPLRRHVVSVWEAISGIPDLIQLSQPGSDGGNIDGPNQQPCPVIPVERDRRAAKVDTKEWAHSVTEEFYVSVQFFSRAAGKLL